MLSSDQVALGIGYASGGGGGGGVAYLPAGARSYPEEKP